MQLYFIRHAQSENNLLFLKTGSYDGASDDPGLSEAGMQQAGRLASHLKADRSGYNLTHLYCSLMVRAVQTGTALSEALGLPLVGLEDLHESGGVVKWIRESGELLGRPGRNRAFFEQNYPNLEIPGWIGEQGWWNRPCEPWAEVLPRARRVVSRLLERHAKTDHKVAVVSHGDFYNYVVCALMGIEKPERAWLNLNNTGISRFDFVDGRVTVWYQNRVDHLPGELIT